jgi:hypothetical protein
MGLADVKDGTTTTLEEIHLEVEAFRSGSAFIEDL